MKPGRADFLLLLAGLLVLWQLVHWAVGPDDDEMKEHAERLGRA